MGAGVYAKRRLEREGKNFEGSFYSRFAAAFSYIETHPALQKLIT
ncbi:hypothetical protein CCACVL1_13852 [Corchorus capsularis]|uniref:Uncharacterized protein n=1 Tax=Corchorus capsularis TaxID=210143 RepID=A0A1R3I9F8_COCAP|nr:hypothetical protein CCACVL1_13852 [Corchorus capsularis]